MQLRGGLARMSISHSRLLTRNFLLLLGATLALFASMQALMPTIPLYILKLGTSPQWLGLVIALFSLASVATRPLVGKLIDTWGRLVILRASGLVFLLALVFYLLSLNIPLFLLARAVHGIGFGGYIVAASALAVDMTPEARKGEALGLFNMGSRLPFLFAPAIGSYMLRLGGFSSAFILSIFMAAVCLFSGMVLEDPSRAYQLSASGPDGYKALLRRPAVISALITSSCVGIAFGVMLAFLPIMTTVKGMTGAGWLFTAFAVGNNGALFAAGWLSDRLGQRLLIVPGLFLAAVGLLALGWGQGEGSLLLAACILGLGVGAIQVLANALVVEGIALTDRGKALSLYTATWDLAIAVGATLFGYLFASDVIYLFWVTGLLCLLGIPLYLVQATVSGSRQPYLL